MKKIIQNIGNYRLEQFQMSPHQELRISRF